MYNLTALMIVARSAGVAVRDACAVAVDTSAAAAIHPEAMAVMISFVAGFDPGDAAGAHRLLEMLREHRIDLSREIKLVAKAGQ